MRPDPNRARGARIRMCKVPACQTSIAALVSGRARSWWMVIRHMTQWRHVPWSLGVSSVTDAEQLTQNRLAIFGETWPRNMRFGGTARCDTMLLRIFHLTACSTVAIHVPDGTCRVGRRTQMPDPFSQAWASDCTESVHV